MTMQASTLTPPSIPVAHRGQPDFNGLRSVVSASAVPPYLMKTDDNPDGPLEPAKAKEMDFREDLNKVTVPTLVLHGDSDGIVPFDGSGKRTHAAIATAVARLDHAAQVLGTAIAPALARQVLPDLLADLPEQDNPLANEDFAASCPPGSPTLGGLL